MKHLDIRTTAMQPDFPVKQAYKVTRWLDLYSREYKLTELELRNIDYVRETLDLLSREFTYLQVDARHLLNMNGPDSPEDLM